MNKMASLCEWAFTVVAGLALGWVVVTTPPPQPTPVPALPPSLIAPESQWASSQHCGCGATNCSMPCSSCCAPNKCICHDNPDPTVADVRSLTVSICRHQ